MTKAPKAAVGCFRATLLALLAVLGLLRPAFAVDTNAAALGAQDFLRSYLQIQEQLHLTQLLVEKNRQETEDTVASNSAALDERLQRIEKSAGGEHRDPAGGTDRTALIVACSFAAMGFLALLLAAFLQWSAMHRLAAAAATLSAAQAMQGLGGREAQLPTARAVEQSSARFLELMEQLQQRIHELEASAKSPPVVPLENHSGNGHANGATAVASSAKILPPPGPDKEGTVQLLLVKGQTLLKLNKSEAALECLDEAIALDPGNAEAQVKKGAALERLQRFDEALVCYDHAIARDNSLIMAYLHKGGVFNRLQRHDEALACYEQALKPGAKTGLQTSSSNKPKNGAAA